MAKRIVDEEMRFSIVVNGNEAQAELYKLEKSTREYTQRNKELRAEQAKLVGQGKKNSAEYKALSAEIKQNSATIDANKNRMSALQKEIGVTGLTMGQLRKQANLLRLQLHNMVPGSAQYKKLEADLQAVNARMTQLRISSQATEGSISKLAGGFNKYAALGATVIASLTGVVLSLQKVIDYNGKLSDAQSDVMKTTGLTKKEVDGLTKSFGAFKTRTTRIELLELAEEAGRLGIEGTANIKAFVEQANKMKVALGDDLSTEQIREVGKMVNIYKVGEATSKDFAGAMDALGSAINEVSASGANQAGFLVEYMKRQAGIAAQTKLSAADNIGYAATFDEVGQSVEVSATAMNKVFIDMFKNTAEYAKIAGMGVAEFKELLAKDANEAMIKFLEGLNGNNEGLSVMVKKMEELDAGGTRGVQALAALASNTDLLRKRQEQSNKSLTEATSLTDEYNIKNNNLAATIEKIQKALIGSFSSEGFINFLQSSVEWFAKFIGATEDSVGRTTEFKNELVALAKIIAVVIAALVTNVAWLRLVALWEGRGATATWLYTAAKKANTIATELAFAASQLYAAATMLLTGNIKGATQAIRVLSATMKTTPWGLVLGLISAVVVAYVAFKDEAKKAETAQTYLNKAIAKGKEETAGLASRMEVLRKIVEDETASQEARLAAVKELNKIVPDYNKDLDLSSKALEKGKEKLDLYIESLERQAQAQFLADQVTLKSRQIMEQQNADTQEYVAWYEDLWEAIKSGGNSAAYAYSLTMKGEEERRKTLEKTRLELDAAKKAYADYLSVNPDTIKTVNDFIATDPDETEAERKKRLAAAQKAAAERKKLIDQLNKGILASERAAQDAKLELLEDGYLEELARMHLAHERKMETLRSQILTESELQKLPAELRKKYAERNEATNKQIEAETQAHNFRQAALVQKGLAQQFKEQEDKYKREKTLRQTKFAEEMAAYAGNEQAQKELRELHQKEELEAEAKHLEELIRQFNQMMAEENFGGFDLSLLTPQQKEEMEKMLEDIKLKLSEVKAAKDAIGKSGGDDGLDLGTGGKVDIFGFSAQDWVDTFTNLDTIESKINAAGMAVQGFLNAWSTYYQYLDQNETRHMREFERKQNRERTKLKNSLDSKMINQRQYDQAVAAMEADMDKRKADLEYKQAKRAWKLQLANAIATAAMATINGFNSTPFLPVGLIMGALAATLGTIQVGIIAKNKPVRGYEEGYYGTFPVEREQDGKIFNARYGGKPKSGMVNDPTILVGEMPELIISNPDLKKFNPEVTASVANEIRRVRGYEGGYTSPAVQNTETPTQTIDTSATDAILLRVATILEKLDENGVTAYLVRDMKNAKKIQDDLEQLKRYEQKSQI